MYSKVCKQNGHALRPLRAFRDTVHENCHLRGRQRNDSSTIVLSLEPTAQRNATQRNGTITAIQRYAGPFHSYPNATEPARSPINALSKTFDGLIADQVSWPMHAA